MRKLTALTLVAAMIAAVFAWGMFAGTRHIFPYDLLNSLRGGGGDKKGSSSLVWGAPGGDDTQLPATGFWHTARDAGSDGGARPADLANLPYLRGATDAPDQARVTVYDSDAAEAGLNLAVSGHAPVAELMDMRGNVLHSWSIAFDDVWPGTLPFKIWEVHRTFWRRAHLYPNGDLLAVFEAIGLIKLDRDSKLLWAHQGRNHHDLDIDDQGRIYTLTKKERPDPKKDGRAGFPAYFKRAYEEDYVTVLSADGVELKSVSLLDCLANSEYATLLGMAPRYGDVLHTNTLEVMDGRFADRHELYAKGNVLVSFPTINTVAVVDMDRETVVWAVTGMSVFQHEPTLLDNGNILMFDNRDGPLGARVIEFDPLTRHIAWSYGATTEQTMRSAILGSCQRLASGNTLITESLTGRALEVTAGGDIVWEYFNPYRAGADDELIACLFDVVRIPRANLDANFVESLVSEEPK